MAKRQDLALQTGGNPDSAVAMQGVQDISGYQHDRNSRAGGLSAGSVAPCFRLDDVDGNPVALVDLLARGPVVLVFYRGTWCGYCDRALNELASSHLRLTRAGATVVAVSPYAMLEHSSQRGLAPMPFTVLDDPYATVAERYGLTRHVPQTGSGTSGIQRGDHFDPTALDIATMPVPATFVIASTGRIAFSYVDADYRKRQQAANLVAVLGALSGRTRLTS